MSQDNPDLNPTGSGSTAAGRPTPPTESFGTTSGDAPTEAVGTTSTTPQTTTADPAPTTDLPAPPELPGDLVVLASERPSLGARLGAEALGTFVLVLLGVGIALYTPLSGATTLGVALAFAFAFTAAAIALGHVSGGHFNPAVTFGAVIAGRTPVRDLVPYWLAQLIGGALAAAALFVTLPEQLAVLIGQEGRRQLFSNTANGYGDHSPLYTQSQGQVTFELMPALLIELVATAVLVGIVLAASSRRVSHAVAPVAMGLTYGALVLLAAPITNAGLNPARSTAASLFSDGWALEQLWLFWAAPLVGAAIAGLAHRAFAVDAGPENLLEEDDVVVDEDSLLDDDVDDLTVGPRA
ncbi:aquaporin [Cellulomonas sp. ATA003]|uniref:aquaporin n=1 Tax=Cellulomonas sp. ATA003 TaxID=3073064 RepID=UPI002872BC11|nr:aquaporin [Cellulomonas sp. ATA003]WNB86088.1 aquaporin [Cellulomonas sp. ATA003]